MNTGPRGGCTTLFPIPILLGLGLLAFACSDNSPAPRPPVQPMPLPGTTAAISMDANNWQFMYSPNMPQHPMQRNEGGWEFEFPDKDGVHYLLHQTSGKLGQEITVQMIVGRSDGAVIVEKEPCGESNAKASIMFMRRGGEGLTSDLPYHRWWSIPKFVLNSDQTELKATLSPDQWLSVFGEIGNASSAASQGFTEAMNDVSYIGLTHGGCFAGHGTFVLGGTAKMIVTNFKL